MTGLRLLCQSFSPSLLGNPHTRCVSMIKAINDMNPNIALTSVVTMSVLEEFKFLKFSFELFHGINYKWFVRCDYDSLQALSIYPNVVSKCSIDNIRDRPDIESAQFHSIMGEKMNAMADAWRSGSWAGVVFFDADIIITAPAMLSFSAVEGDVVLAPNYHHPQNKRHLDSEYGNYNGGFAFTRTRHFHEWWQAAYRSRPVGFADQICLNDAHKKFTVGVLPERSNIGFWRAANAPEYGAIPADCDFLHVHLFQPLRTMRQWIDKTFALHCLNFLQNSPIKEHHVLFNEVLIRDKSRWYEACLRLS
jgi:hypothetical protein